MECTGIQRSRDPETQRPRDTETDTTVGEPSTLTQEHWEVLSEVFGLKSLVLQVEWSIMEKGGVMRVWRVEDHWMIMEGSWVRSSRRCGNRDLLGLGGEIEVGEGINERSNWRLTLIGHRILFVQSPGVVE